MQGPLTELRADDEVENASAELVVNAPHLRQYGLRAADDHLAECHAVGEIAPRRALPLGQGVGAVIARLPHPSAMVLFWSTRLIRGGSALMSANASSSVSATWNMAR